MGLMDKLIDLAVYGSRPMKNIDRPTFLKEFSKENPQLKDLEELSLKINNAYKRNIIEKDIYALKRGIEGENNVYYELKNCSFPILCLHDIRLEYDGLTAQIDFIVLTKQYCCIIETKQLYGDIIIDKDGNFIRSFKNKSGHTIKEGMYSPIEQNKRHVNLIKKILKQEFNINNMPVNSIVVLANPKTIINNRYCPKEIKEKVIRCEHLSKYLQDGINNTEYSLEEEEVFQVANYFVANNKPIVFDYYTKYGLCENDFIKATAESEQSNIISTTKETIQTVKNVNTDKSIKSSEQLEKELKEFRLKVSRENNIKPYFVFNNVEMSNLINRYPKNMEDILSVKGFGQVKVNKYGEEILKIFNQE
jgi:hypothetical protein